MERERAFPAAFIAALAVAVTAGALHAEAVYDVGEAEVPPGMSGASLPLRIDADPAEGPISGWSLVLEYDPSAIGNVFIENARDADFVVSKVQEDYVTPGTVSFVCIYGLPFDRPEREITTENDGLVANLRFCVLPDAAPGAYPVVCVEDRRELHLGQPQFNHYSVEGQTHVPVLSNGGITISGDPVEMDECPEDVHEFVPPDPIPEPPEGFVLEGTFALADGEGVAGGSATIPLTMRGNWEIRGYSFSIDFDETLLEGAAIDEVWQLEGGEEFDFHIYERNNSDELPGGSGVEEGFMVGAVIFSHLDPAVFMPRDTDIHTHDLTFSIKPTAEPGTTEILFVDGARFSTGSQPIANVMTIDGTSVDPAEESSFVFIPASFNVLPDIQVFIRGDTNGDELFDVSDPSAGLNYLFIGGESPACYDAADANDDGLMNVSDASYALAYLFLGGPPPPAPFPETGPDPTPDALGCLVLGES